MYQHAHTHRGCVASLGLRFKPINILTPNNPGCAHALFVQIYTYIDIEIYVCINIHIHIHIVRYTHIEHTHTHIYIYIKFRADRILLNGLQHVWNFNIFFCKTWCFDRANIQIFYLLNRVYIYIYICTGANCMQVSSELCVWNWFKCAGNILSVDSVCIFTGFSPVFVQLEKGVGANLKQVYKSTSRLLLHVELVEWSKEYSKCEFYLCICMVSFVGMHHLDRTHWNKQSTQWKNKTGKPLKE